MHEWDAESSVRVDPYDYFTNHRGRRVVPPSGALGRGNTSQIVLGTDTSSMRDAAAARKREEPQYHHPLHPHAANTPVGRRRRGPGTDFAQRIAAEGFPSDVAVRKRQHEMDYHYDTEVLHTHKRLGDPAMRQERGTVDLFAYQPAPVNREAIRHALRTRLSGAASHHARQVPLAEREYAGAVEMDTLGHAPLPSSSSSYSVARQRQRQPWERDSDGGSGSWEDAPVAHTRDHAPPPPLRERHAHDVCERLRLWCDLPTSKAALRDPWVGF